MAEKIDLTKIDELSLSAVMRELNKQTSEDNVLKFMKTYHKLFNDNVLNEKKNIDKLSLIETLVEFNKSIPVKINKNLTKSASFNYNKAWNTLSKVLQLSKYL